MLVRIRSNGPGRVRFLCIRVFAGTRTMVSSVKRLGRSPLTEPPRPPLRSSLLVPREDYRTNPREGGQVDLNAHLHTPLQASLRSTLIELFWYALMASAVWLLFSVAFRAAFRHRRISRGDPTARQVGREIAHSLRSIAVFGLVTLAMVSAARLGWTRLYYRVGDYGWSWFVLRLGLVVGMHTTYFYWTDGLLHHRRLYRPFHHTHHLSTSPTPWAAYAFSPAEALVQASIGPVIVLTLPVHPTAFAAFMVWQITFNVLGHCGYELF